MRTKAGLAAICRLVEHVRTRCRIVCDSKRVTPTGSSGSTLRRWRVCKHGSRFPADLISKRSQAIRGSLTQCSGVTSSSIRTRLAYSWKRAHCASVIPPAMVCESRLSRFTCQHYRKVLTNGAVWEPSRKEGKISRRALNEDMV